MLPHSPELILIVDDTPANLDIISDALSEAGFDVAIALSGEQALKQLKLYVPDLILLDVTMPGMDGFEVCRLLKSEPTTQEIPVIFMTALADTPSKTKGFEVGAVDYITKPFQSAEVLARIKTHLQLHRLTQHLEYQVAQRTTNLVQALQALQASQAQLEANERKYRAIFDQTFQFTALLALDGTLLEANQPLLTFGGVQLAEVLGRPLWDTPWWRLGTDPPSRLQQAITHTIQGELIRYEEDIVGAHGTVATIDLSLRPLQNEAGQVLLLIVEGRDISAYKAIAAQLKHQAHQLEAANRQLANYSQTLERRVEERTQALSQALANLQATQQDLIQSEKMAALGQLTASVAHEINNPLGVIRGAASNIAAAFQVTLQQLPALLQQLSPPLQAAFFGLVDAALKHQHPLSTKEERQSRRRLQAELGRQGVTVADATVVDEMATYLTLLQVELDLDAYQPILQAPNGLEILRAAYHLVLQQQSTTCIQQEVDRAAKIVFALKTYSHHSHFTEKRWSRVTDGIEVALTLYQNRLKQGIQVICQYADVPEVWCNADEMTQVWVNLVDNAIYAMAGEGILAISVTQQAEYVVVDVRDSGGGISPEIQDQIFDPFFTTKPRGEGSGLGLDIVHRIVQSHAGDITVTSQPGQTTFTVRLPWSINGGEFRPDTRLGGR